MLREPVRPGAADAYADMPVSAVTLKTLKVLRDNRSDAPEMANQRVKTLRQMFRWAFDQEHVVLDPSRDLAKIKVKSAGHHTWTVEEVAQFEARHPIGSKARLALALLLWTGVRRQDVVRLGKQHRCRIDGKPGLAFNTSKNGVRVEIPVLPCLQEVIDASPTGDLTFIVGARGEPWDAHTFGNWFRKRCVEAGVPGRAHGLRKAGAVTAAENNATPHQLMAIYGWRSLKEPERYTRAAERRRMAGEAMQLLVRKG
jgi:integrase